MRISNYNLAQASTPGELITEVRYLMEAGWTPFGSPSGVERGGMIYWIQSMVKYEEVEK